MEKDCIKNYSKWYWALPGILFLILCYLVSTNLIIGIDQSIYTNISYLITPYLTAILKGITNMGSATVMITIGVLVLFKNRKIGVFLLCNLTIIYLLNEITKLIFLRIRPDILWLTHASGYSFPSGHSMVSFCFYGMLVYLLMKTTWKNKQIMMIAIWILVILIGFSRIYLGVHYFSDVIGGFLFAGTYLLFIINNFPLKT